MTFLVALWFSFMRFLANLFSKPSNTPLPVPVTARTSRPHPPETSSDRSPTTMSDGSLEVISLGDRTADISDPLPSPWSPIGKKTSQDVWMSVDGMLMNATGPTMDDDDDATRMLSLSTISLYSTSSVLDTFGISVFVNLTDSTTLSKRHENRPTLVTTPSKQRDTLTSFTGSNVTPLTKRDNADTSHLRTASSISSLAYELRMGLFADGRSMSAFDNIIPLLDQASPESIPAVEVI